MNKFYTLGIDVGSTTVKTVLMLKDEIVYGKYERHFSDIKEAVKRQLSQIFKKFGDIDLKAVITGSGGIDLSKRLGIKFEQEVICSTKAIKLFYPDTDSIIELGGEDAKVTFLSGGIDQRMNGICAGGTGAFIDQMASLLKVDAGELNKLAKDYKVIYPIASRCGVFAKTDIQPLINDGASKADIAMSIFNAVVIQTVSVLSCGRKIVGKVAFLGGPLFFLSQLRERFINVLGLDRDKVVFPENAQLYVAMGASLLARHEKSERLSHILAHIENIKNITMENTNSIAPLFKDKQDYSEFKDRHAKDSVKRVDLNNYKGKVYLGLDAGSTTTKAVLMGENNELLYTHYGSNEGSPLKMSIKILKKIYSLLPKGVEIASAVVTGYGENLIKKSLRFDGGEIETIAHYKAAKFFTPDVDFILDIGGQDMKCLRVSDGVISQIILNEACSSGCGSFVESFAKSLNTDIGNFVKEGIKSQNPVDLGSRCTVFMNSRVKQAQKEGATVSDISAGLAYSVIKNALFKVVKLRSVDELGKNIVVQGGTFYNDLVLRAFENLIGKNVTRPDIAGLMGAFGCAILAKERSTGKSTVLVEDELVKIDPISKVQRCVGCTNKCLLTIHQFSGNDIFVSGNRCEVGEVLYTKVKKEKDKDIVNMYKYKYDKIFSYKSLNNASRGEIGIPRVLNMYENYPFWHTFFTKLGFKVVLSAHSNKKLFEKGIDSIASDTVCYPAKLVHGHIEDLIKKGIKTIFYPSVAYEYKESDNLDNHYNCPVVTSYPQVIKNNMDSLIENNIKFVTFFISLDDKEKLKKRLYIELKEYFDGISQKEINNAVDSATQTYDDFKADIRHMGEKTLEHLRQTGKKAYILAGRPYHIDPEIHHGIPDFINSLGISVLTEDAVAHLSENDPNLRVVNQWVYHSRLYKAANFIRDKENLEMVQLNSFGCGLDAVTTEQVEEILAEDHKIHTVIKIDEGNNLGAVKIRLRSLKAAIGERDANPYRKILPKKVVNYDKNTRLNTNHTLLIPQMAPVQFQFLEKAFELSGLKAVVLHDESREVIEEGLKYVNNDACYPAIVAIGQLIHALKSGKYDPNNTSVLMSQTGGGCRATNYISFLRRAMKAAGFEQVPVVSVSMTDVEDNGIRKHLNTKFFHKTLMGIIYGDLLMKVLLRIRPYEKEKGSAQRLYEKWVEICKKSLVNGKFSEFKKNVKNIVKEFDEIPINDIIKPKVGLVGEIFVKFSPLANNDLINVLELEGAEVVVPDLMNFFLAVSNDTAYKHKHFNNNLKAKLYGQAIVKIIEIYQGAYANALKTSKRFNPLHKIKDVANHTKDIISLGNQTGEGWLLPGEMIELVRSGCNNVVCMQPFGCLPNHILGKGAIKAIKKDYPQANIIAIDYDASAAFVNQLNRIKLMLGFAKNEENNEN